MIMMFAAIIASRATVDNGHSAAGSSSDKLPRSLERYGAKARGATQSSASAGVPMSESRSWYASGEGDRESFSRSFNASPGLSPGYSLFARSSSCAIDRPRHDVRKALWWRAGNASSSIAEVEARRAATAARWTARRAELEAGLAERRAARAERRAARAAARIRRRSGSRGGSL